VLVIKDILKKFFNFKYLVKVLTPNYIPDGIEFIAIRLFLLIMMVYFWSTSTSSFFPSIQKIIAAYSPLIHEDQMFFELWTSTKLYFHCLALVIAIGAVFSYLSVIPMITPIASLLSRFRALSLVGVLLLFTVIMPDGYNLKLAVIVFGTTPWLITSMRDIIKNIPQEKYDLARSLRFPEWKVTWYVVVRGQLHQVIDAISQVSLMIIVLLPVAEKIVRSGGGIGYLLTGLERFHTNDRIWAINIILIIAAIGLEYFFKFLRGWWCPYAIRMENGGQE
jgi:ABC-type nitrate/sulfonate/bicarbonate transport system permease component